MSAARVNEDSHSISMRYEPKTHSQYDPGPGKVRLMPLIPSSPPRALAPVPPLPGATPSVGTTLSHPTLTPAPASSISTGTIGTTSAVVAVVRCVHEREREVFPHRFQLFHRHTTSRDVQMYHGLR